MRWQFMMIMTLAAVCMLVIQDAAAQTARERLHDAYRILVEAQALTSIGEMEEAKLMYRDAIVELERLQRYYPGWQREVVSARLAHARNRLARLEDGEYNGDDDENDTVQDPVESDRGPVAAVDLELAWRKELARHQDRLRQLRNENTALKSRLRAVEMMPAHAGVETSISEPIRNRMARLMVEESERLQAEREYNVARELLEAARTVAPNDFAVRLALGVAYCREGRFTPASRILRGVVSEDPTNVTARLALGAAWLGLDNIGAARAEIEAALQADPENADAHYNMARLLMMLPDAEPIQARRHYRRSVALGGDTDLELDNIIQREALEQFGRDR